MEYLIINHNKLKITMSQEDMKTHGIDPKDAGYESPQIRRAFWRVLDSARDGCGFSVVGEKVLIQFYPSGDGGEVFVTKLGKVGNGAEKMLSSSESVTMLSSRTAIYKFSSVHELIGVSRRLSEEAKNAASEVYYSEDGAYYLVLEERSHRGAPSELSLFGEFAREVPYTLLPYIREHSVAIAARNALSILSRL